MTPVEAAREMMRRRELRQSFRAWCCYVLAPLGQSPAAHHDLLIDALQAMADDKIDRLMVAMPPGSAKSTYVSQLFPPWYMARDPTKSMIAASNTTDLAERWGRRVRNLIAENAGVLGYGVAEDNAAAGRWGTTAGGEYFAAGVGAAITGRRADCVTENTQVIGLDGSFFIKNVVVGTPTGYILSYDISTETHCFRRVLSVVRRDQAAIWHIRTASGQVVECTADHRFYVRGRWRKASSLRMGEVLLSSLHEAKVASSCGSGQADKKRTQNVLRSPMRQSVQRCGPRHISASLPTLRRLNAQRLPFSEDVFHQVSQGFLCGKGIEEKTSSVARKSLPSMLGFVRAQELCTQGRGLQSRMRRQATFHENVCQRQSRLEGWGQPRRECEPRRCSLFGSKRCNGTSGVALYA